MSQHITRKELKQDRFAEALTHGVEEVKTHQQQAWLIGGIALAILVIFAGWRFWNERQTLKAIAAFEEAAKTYNARIRTAGEPEEPGEITYVDEKNKYIDAAKKFEKVASDFSITKPGRAARYYVGLCHANLGHWEDAQKWFRQVEGGSDEELAALGRLQLADVLAHLGKGEDAVKLYQALIAKPTTMVPKQTSMFALAEHYRKSNPSEAIKLYNQIKTEFPDTGVADQADERLQELQPKS